MKKVTMVTMVLLVGIGLIAIGSHAQERRGRRGGRFAFRRGPSLTEALAKLDLTQTKQRQIQRILLGEQQLRETNASQIARLEQERAAAREAGDAAEADALAAQIAELRSAGSGSRRRTMAELRKILTPEQFTALEEALTEPGRAVRIGAVLRELGNMQLNIRQEAMVDKAFDEAIEKVKSILSVEQRESLQEAMEQPMRGRGGGFGGMGRNWWRNLSEAQQSALREVRQEYMERLRDAQGEERWEIMREMGERMRQVASSSQEQQPESEPEEPEQEAEGEQGGGEEGEQ